MTESLRFCLKMLVASQGFFGPLSIVNVEIYSNPVQQCPIACSERLEATEKPAILSFGVSNSEGCLAGSPSSVAGFSDSKRFFMIIGMYQLDVGVPRHIDLDPEPKWIVLSETKVVRISLIHVRKSARRQCVPCVRRNRIERLSQLCGKRWFVPKGTHSGHSIVPASFILRMRVHACTNLANVEILLLLPVEATRHRPERIAPT
jgi:hypothetical protein